MGHRNLSQKCSECAFNDHNITWCMITCDVPLFALLDHESYRNNKMKGGSVYGTVCKKEDSDISCT